MLKATGEEGLTTPKEVLNAAWRKGAVPKDWKVGMLIFKKVYSR